MDAPTLLAAGSNGRGQLATGDSRDAYSFTPCKCARRESSTSPDIISIVGGGNHTLALLSWENDSAASLEVWGCGEGTKGQLGPGFNADSEGRDESAVLEPLNLPWEEQGLIGYTISHVAACWETSFFVLRKNDQYDLLASMGGNDFGDLGIGDLPSKKKIKAICHIVDFSHIVGSTAQRVSITDITAGPHHVIVLLHADQKQYIAGWGTARHGQLGPLLAPSGRALPFSPSPVAIDLPIDVQLDPVLSVRAGNRHSVFLHASGHISALGSDAKGQLQDLRTAEDVQAIDCTWNGTYIRTSLGLLSKGTNARGQLGRREHASKAPSGAVRFPVEASVLDFACGSEHVLAIVETRGMWEVWGWGWNEHGNLGTGSSDDVGLPVKIWPPPTAESEAMTSVAVRVWAGCGTSWIAVSKCATPISRCGDAGRDARA